MQDLLRSASSLTELAREIGSVCLNNERRLVKLRGERLAEKANPEDKHRPLDEASGYLYLEQLVAQIRFREWQPRAESGFAHIFALEGIADAIEEVETDSPLEYLAFLRGMCPVLGRLYAQVTGRIPLDHGMPIPYATRPLKIDDKTPYPRHLGNRELLYRLDFKLFPHSRSSSVPVTLDFSRRFRLDELTWTAKEELPLIASMHPSMREADQAKPTRHGNRFFNVRPREFSPDQVLAWLSSVKDCEIAILPELTLPEPDALAASLRSAPADYPPLIVAGSAHASLVTDSGRTIRVNESQVYLDGERIHAHRKIHPLESRHFGKVQLPHPVIEDITDDAGELIVLSGEHTRLAVVICADLNEQEIPALLTAAGVNLLLVPVMTYSAGAFTGAVTSLASQCQAVCALANTDLRTSNARDPFLTLVAVPRATPFEQCRSYPARAEPSPPAINGSAPRAIFDPNQPLPLEIQWR